MNILHETYICTFSHRVSSLIDFVFDRFRSSNPGTFADCFVQAVSGFDQRDHVVRIWKMHCSESNAVSDKRGTSTKQKRKEVGGRAIKTACQRLLINFDCNKRYVTVSKKNNLHRHESGTWRECIAR